MVPGVGSASPRAPACAGGVQDADQLLGGAQLQERPRFLAGRAAAPGNAQEKALSGPNPARRSYTARYHHGLTRLSAFDLTADRQQRKAQQHRPDEAQYHLDQPSCVGQRLLGGKERGR